MKFLIAFLILFGSLGISFAEQNESEEAIPIVPPEYQLVTGQYLNDELGFGLVIPESMTGFLWTSSGIENLVTIQMHPESVESSCCPPLEVSPAVILLDNRSLQMSPNPVPFIGDLYSEFQGYNMNLSIENLNGTEVLVATLDIDRDDIPDYGHIKRIGKFYYFNSDKRALSYGLYASPEYYAKYIKQFEESAKSINIKNVKSVNLNKVFNYADPVKVKLENGSSVYYKVFSSTIIDI